MVKSSSEPEWPSGLQRRAGRTVVGLSPGRSQTSNACRHVCKYVDQKSLAAMLTSIQSAGVAPEVNLRITQARKHAKRIHPGFKTQGKHHQKSNTGVSGVP